jgi:hypothetical protein
MEKEEIPNLTKHNSFRVFSCSCVMAWWWPTFGTQTSHHSNPLKTNGRPLYLKDPSLYRAVNTSHLGYKNHSVYGVSGTSYCSCSDKYRTHKHSVSSAYSCCTLNLLVHHWTSRRKRICQSIATIYIHKMISFIWLHVSTRNESSSGHLNVLLWTKNFYKWYVSSLQDPIRLYDGYTGKTHFKTKVIW